MIPVSVFLSMNVLCIDFGLARVGTAVGSTESGIAFARETYERDENLLSTLNELIQKAKIQRVLIGRPYQRDGAEGDIYEHLQDFVEQVKKIFEGDIEYIDERYSSKIAAQQLTNMGMKAKEQHGKLDAHAAQILLQEWFDQNVTSEH